MKKDFLHQKNEIVELQITGMSAEGAGVGHLDGYAVFVPNTVLGDIIEAKLLKVNKTYAFAKTEKMLREGPGRCKNDCSAFPRCGGCVYRHIAYETESAYKEQKVRDAFQRIGGFTEIPLSPIVVAQNSTRYRNKAQYPIGEDAEGNLVMGFYGVNSHRVIPTEDCLLQPSVFATICSAFLEFAKEQGLRAYQEETGTGLLRHLYLRRGEHSKEIMVCVVATGKLPKADLLCKKLISQVPEIKTVVLNINREKTNVILGSGFKNLYGDGTIRDSMCGVQTVLSAPSFYQVNTIQAERLYQLAGEYASLTGKEIVLDLYCGAGLIGLSMAQKAKQIVGAEIVPEAVENAKQNALTNHITNAEFICADASEAALYFKKQGLSPDVVIVDPPRKGLTEELIETISSMKPKRVVYVSCDCATLARDAKSFSQKGYFLQEVTPVDLFPRTSHVETCVLLVNSSR